jgi:hypothetical protein
VLLYKALLEASARHQRSDTARKLAAHRVAWATMASARAAGATMHNTERDAGAPNAIGPAAAQGTTNAADGAPPVPPVPPVPDAPDAPDAPRPPA